ncbi:hypothetical protein QFZ91_008454 [Paraburkholderia sp. JPY419]
MIAHRGTFWRAWLQQVRRHPLVVRLSTLRLLASSVEFE